MGEDVELLTTQPTIVINLTSNTTSAFWCVWRGLLLINQLVLIHYCVVQHKIKACSYMYVAHLPNRILEAETYTVGDTQWGFPSSSTAASNTIAQH